MVSIHCDHIEFEARILSEKLRQCFVAVAVHKRQATCMPMLLKLSRNKVWARIFHARIIHLPHVECENIHARISTRNRTNRAPAPHSNLKVIAWCKGFRSGKQHVHNIEIEPVLSKAAQAFFIPHIQIRNVFIGG